jgi:hypothetical protein
MADNARDLKLKLSATGGDAAAKEVLKVEEATEAIASTAADAKKAINDLAAEIDHAGEEAAPAAKELKEMEAQLDAVEEKAHAAQAALKRVTAANPGVASSSSNSGLAVLEFSRAVEDLQYGIRGVINNIPTLLGYLGMSGGIAGGVSLAVVAISQLIPLMSSLGDESEAEAEKFAKAQEFAEEAAARIEKRLKAVRDARIEAEASNVNDLGKAALDRWKSEGDAIDRTIGLLRAYQSAKLEEISGSAAIETARVNAQEASGEISKVEAIQKRAAIVDEAEAKALAEKQKAAETEIALAQKRVELAQATQADLEKAAANAARQASGSAAANAAAQGIGPQIVDAQGRVTAAENAMAVASGSVAAFAGSMVDTPQAAQARAEAAKAREELLAARKALADLQAIAEKTDLDAIDSRAKADAEAAQAARERAEEARRNLETLRQQVEAETELIRVNQQKDARNAATRAEVRGIELGTAVGNVQREAQAAAVNQQAAALAQSIEQQIAAAPGAANDQTGLIAALQGIAGALQNGTNQTEVLALAQQLATVAAGLSAEQQAARAKVQAIEQQLAQLASQFANRPER